MNNHNNSEKRSYDNKNRKQVTGINCQHCVWKNQYQCKFKNDICFKSHQRGHLASICRNNMKNNYLVSQDKKKCKKFNCNDNNNCNFNEKFSNLNINSIKLNSNSEDFGTDHIQNSFNVYKISK